MSLAEKSDKYSSKHWIPQFKVLANEFLVYCHAQVGGQYVKLDISKFEKIEADYCQEVEELKKYIYGKEKEINKIDQHKIISLYIYLIVKHKPFYYDSLQVAEYPCFFVRLANEYFCLSVVVTILMGWNNKEVVPELPRGYIIYFVILLYYYKDIIRSSDIMYLSHIIYFIELTYVLTIK